MGAPFKVIGGVRYAFDTIPAEAALDVEVSVVRLFGEPVFALLAGSGNETPQAEQMAAVAAAMRALSNQPNHVALKAELKELLGTVLKHVIGPAGIAQEIASFNGKNKLLWEVAIEALKVNFADFLGASPSTSPPPEAAA